MDNTTILQRSLDGIIGNILQDFLHNILKLEDDVVKSKTKFFNSFIYTFIEFSLSDKHHTSGNLGGHEDKADR